MESMQYRIRCDKTFYDYIMELKFSMLKRGENVSQEFLTKKITERLKKVDVLSIQNEQETIFG